MADDRPIVGIRVCAAYATCRTIPANEINVLCPYIALEHLGLTPAGPDQP